MNKIDAESVQMFTGQDVVIILDVTWSMGGVLEAMKKYLAKYIIRRCMQEPINSLGLCLVDDHYYEGYRQDNDSAYPVPFIWFGMTENLEEFMFWLLGAKLGDGADGPEAFDCAIASVKRDNPDASIWIVTDSVPHSLAAKVKVRRLWFRNESPNNGGCACGIESDFSSANVVLVCSESKSKVTDEALDIWYDAHCNVLLVPQDSFVKQLKANHEEVAVA